MGAFMKTTFIWDSTLATGFSEVDLQHKKLVFIIEDVRLALNSESKNYTLAISKALKSLMDYTEYHFSEEEALMKKHGYPSLDAHKKEHAAFIFQVRELLSSINTQNREAGEKFYSFLGTWLFAHIARSDKAWAVYIEGKQK